MCDESQIVGPPGTGKTKTLDDRVEVYRALDPEDGLLLATSYSNTAVNTLRMRLGRHFTDASMTVRTLHSFGYQQLGAPPIIGGRDKAGREAIARWNSEYPHWRMSGELNEDGEEIKLSKGEEAPGDVRLMHVDYLRHKLIPETEWARLYARHWMVEDFWPAWRRFKASHGVVDFTDQIAFAYEQGFPCPFPAAKHVVLDEAQDFTPLMTAWVRAWGKPIDAALDDDQALNGYNGGDPSPWIDVEDPDRMVLPQSYRMARAIHDYSQVIVRRIKHRIPKEFLPRDAEGSVEYSPARIWSPDDVVELVKRELDAAQTVMVVASANYMLSGLTKALKDGGLTFHNRYRPKNRAWNPLSPGRGTAAAVKAHAVMTQFPDWTWQHVQWMAELLTSTKVMFQNAAEVKRQAKEHPGDYFDGWHLLREDALNAFAGNPQRFMLDNSTDEGVLYALASLAHGPEYLLDEPRLTVGTVHSVKGAEADTVLVAPNLSYAAYEEWGARPDDIHRLFYVATTRARDRLVLLSGGNRDYRWRYQ